MYKTDPLRGAREEIRKIVRQEICSTGLEVAQQAAKMEVEKCRQCQLAKQAAEKGNEDDTVEDGPDQ